MGKRRLNRIVIEDGFAKVDLGEGLFSSIDIEDVPLIAGYTWSATPPSPRGRRYAATGSGGGSLFMHRLLMKPPKGMEVDHGDHDGLNNRRYNLEITTHSRNLHNHDGPYRSSKTRVHGVHLEQTACGPRYFAKVTKDGRSKKKVFPATEQGLADAGFYVVLVRAKALEGGEAWERLFNSDRTCIECGFESHHKALGMCKRCYARKVTDPRRRERRRLAKANSFHPI